MLTLDQIKQAVVDKSAPECCFDGRNYARLSEFFPVEDWGILGVRLRDGAEPPTPTPLTREVVIERLKSDVEFAFEKALDRRGLSTGLMWETVQTWLWVLEDDLARLDEERHYAQYGLPLYKAVALKYGFPNPIGDDAGTEHKYSDDYVEDEST